MDGPFADMILRLGAAVIGGIAIGINRDLTNKPIGMRTLALVALGAAGVTVATVQFQDLAHDAEAISRVLQGIIQGIMTGIGFIGAGVILRDNDAQEVHGLTTAASVWVTAGLGIVCGLGAWIAAITMLVLALVLLVIVGWLEKKLHVKS
jgi:putative Mg2+ transporter-C (MgtC) family protein